MAEEEVFYLSVEDHRIVKAVDEHPEKILNFISATPTPILEATVAKRIYLFTFSFLNPLQSKNTSGLTKRTAE